MSNCKFTKSENKGVLKFSGELTIQNAKEMKRAISNAFKKVPHLSLDLQEVEEVDLSFLQLLCASAVTAKANGCELAVVDAIPENVQQASYYTGISHIDFFNKFLSRLQGE